jgi:hypothetical protein
MNPKFVHCLLVSACCSLHGATLLFPRFKAIEIDSHVEIGYGVTVADVDGDGKPDILLADKKQIVWYQNPTWKRFVIAENLTPLDDVCIAAADVDGSGKASIAVGAQWNPGDTVNSGAVFYLIPPADRTQKWEPVELPHEPTVHRMRWMRTGEGFDLVVAPLHGRANKGGQGEGVRILSYHKPEDPRQPWKTELVNNTLHMTHNFDLLKSPIASKIGMFVAAKEGVFELTKGDSNWFAHQIVGPTQDDPGFAGAGEVRSGRLGEGRPFLATVEPMHGTNLVLYTPPADPKALWKRQLLDSSLQDGHALACGDLLGNGVDQIVVGWRGKNKDGKVGIKIFSSTSAKANEWSQTVLDDDTMACEDLCLADLNNDGKLDIIASGRATKNLKIYLNQGAE